MGVALKLADRTFRELARVGALPRWHVGLRTIIERGTLKRLRNLVLVEAECRLGRPVVSGFPYVLVIDPIGACNLRCPLCAMGLGKMDRSPRVMSWSTYTEIIEKLAPYAFKVNFFNWGEPLLHRDLCRMIAFASERNLATMVSSNLSTTLDDTDIENLIGSGLDFLSVSIDGACQETYGHYRRGGDFARVITNLERVLACRKQRGKKRPEIEWQFVRMKHNECELATACEMASAMGVDRFRVIDVILPFGQQTNHVLREEWVPQSWHEDAGPRSNRPCASLYRYLVVNPDGRVSPCCRVFGRSTDFGDSRTGSFRELWNNSYYVSARLLPRSRPGTSPVLPTVCEECRGVKAGANGRDTKGRHTMTS